MDIDPSQPYGPLIESTVRVATWNVWGRYGPWQARQPAIAATLAEHAPDVVAVQEAWAAENRDQATELGTALGLPARAFDSDRVDEDSRSGVAVLSRWPITYQESFALAETRTGGGIVLRADIDGPRGPLHVFSVILDWPPHYSGVRQRQVRRLAELVRQAGRDDPVIVCGDFNAAPDTDEIRMLTGRAAGCEVYWHDAWALAGSGPGHTWSNGNPWVAPSLLPDARIDYVFSPWGRSGGAGYPVRAELLGTRDVHGVLPSDHYGILAELRY